jgi:hypothetical protein
MRDPKITMDTVRVALQLRPDMRADAADYVLLVIRDAAELGRLARQIQRLNEADCNLGSGDAARDKRRDRLVARGQAIATRYGATFHSHGLGGGLWPRIDLAGGGSVTP